MEFEHVLDCIVRQKYKKTRSDAFINGFWDFYRLIRDNQRIANPYLPGQERFDAYELGVAEARAHWQYRLLKERVIDPQKDRFKDVYIQDNAG